MDEYLKQLEGLFPKDNPVFSGGFGVLALATGVQMLRNGSKLGVKLLKRHFLATLEVTSKDRSYPWVLQWVTSRGTKTQHLSVETSFKPTTGNVGNMRFDLVPGPGRHLIFYKGTFLFVERTREAQMLDMNSGKPWEKVEFTAVGRNTSIFTMLLSDAYEQSSKLEENKTIIFTNWGSEWKPFGQPRKKRSIDSVILDNGVAERLIDDVSEWMASSAWYSERGIPYRRGYLLHGPPGSGKSSFIMALAGKLQYNICILNLAERGLTDDRLALALSNIPPQSIVLLEDIDAAFPSRTDNDIVVHGSGARQRQQGSSDVTFSGLLNVLDGVASSEERLVFMTTNHVDRLDPALIRPGRVDYVQLVGDASDHQVLAIFARFYPQVAAQTAERFLADMRATLPHISMAMLQGYLLRHKDNAEGAVANVGQLVSGEYSYRPAAASAEPPVKAGSSSKAPIAGQRRPHIATGGSRRVTAEEVDRMVFNPQEGWDRDLHR